ncbi:hypothetical protein [Oceanicella actignis]|uniref:Lipoprotein n=1 Tax=Oceanicella actignis TaxID=1189325 RepID=A0A1M7RWQ0_9RHOB|nr:hypothetical protein [Oceanicella actignis]SES99259.1 hypothetical protein SAMN04488119_102266 [Oceanicella actignis]SHN50729.1 hypothetical protein SAMN05216200_101252 [Oceanicella actignis]
MRARRRAAIAALASLAAAGCVGGGVGVGVGDGPAQWLAGERGFAIHTVRHDLIYDPALIRTLPGPVPLSVFGAAPGGAGAEALAAQLRLPARLGAKGLRPAPAAIAGPRLALAFAPLAPIFEDRLCALGRDGGADGRGDGPDPAAVARAQAPRPNPEGRADAARNTRNGAGKTVWADVAARPPTGAGAAKASPARVRVAAALCIGARPIASAQMIGPRAAAPDDPALRRAMSALLSVLLPERNPEAPRPPRLLPPFPAED